MPDGSVKNTFTIDNSQALKAIADAHKEISRLEKENAKLAKTSKQGSQEDVQARAEARKLIASLVTEQEKHNQRVEQLNQLRQKGKISEEQHAAAVAKSNAELSKSGEASADVKRLLESLVTEQEKHNTRVAELDRLLKEGRISQEQYNAAVAKSGAELSKSGEASADTKRLLGSLVTEQEKHNKRVADLSRLLKDGKISQDQYNAAVNRSKADLDAAGQSEMAAFGPAALGMIKGMVAAVGGTVGLAGAWRLVVDEINAANEARQRFGAESVTVAQAQAGALRNLGATTPKERDEFISGIEAMADKIGVEQKGLYMIAEDALSARGNLSIEQAMKAVEIGAQVAPDDMIGTGKAFAGASLDIAKLSGATAEQSAGFLMNVGQMARVTDTGKMARSVTPALTAAMAHEGSLPTAGALYAALTGGMGDATGEQSKTAMIKFVDSLDEFLPEVGSMADRIAKLQGDENLRAQFLDKYSFEAAAKAPIEQIVSGEGATAEAYADFMRRMPEVGESGDFFRNWLQVFQTASLQITAAMDRAGAKLVEDLRTADQGAARAGIATKDLQKVLVDAGMPSLGAKLNSFGAYIADDQIDQVLKIFEQRATALEAGPVILGSGYQGSWYTPGGAAATQEKPQHGEPTESDLEKAKILRAYIAAFRSLLAMAADGALQPPPATVPVQPAVTAPSEHRQPAPQPTARVQPAAIEQPKPEQPQPPPPAPARIDEPAPPQPVPVNMGPRNLGNPPAPSRPPAPSVRDPSFTPPANRPERSEPTPPPEIDTSRLEQQGERQTRALTEAIEKTNEELRGLRDDIRQAAREAAPAPVGPPLPSSSSLANGRFR